MNSRTGRVESTFSEICNPGEVPDAFITELTGISAEAVSGAKPIKEVLEAFWAWFANQQVGGLTRIRTYLKLPHNFLKLNNPIKIPCISQGLRNWSRANQNFLNIVGFRDL